MPTIKRDYIKLKRNSICPCEENDKRDKPKKYKNCCLKKIQDREQKTYEMIHESKRITEAKKHVAAAIQFDIDHPIILLNNELNMPGNGGSDIIIP